MAIPYQPEISGTVRSPLAYQWLTTTFCFLVLPPLNLCIDGRLTISYVVEDLPAFSLSLIAKILRLHSSFTENK